MSKTFSYTTLANRFTARFPLLTYISTQINFWILANILLVSILHFHSRVIAQANHMPLPKSFGPLLLTAVFVGFSYGIIVGLTAYYFERMVLRTRSIGLVICMKTLTSLVVLALLLALFRYLFADLALSQMILLRVAPRNESSFGDLLCLLLVYYLFMSLVIAFINQVNKKYGPGVLIPLLLGRYRNPREEKRIFMFMDLKSSTATAEALGHLKYSAFIRDCFFDINQVLYPFRAQVYQYVGDEIVVTWPEQEGLRRHLCIRFYFACKEKFRERDAYYFEHYGFLPHFKASVHSGPVTAVEIGEYKRDIAYHGDTLNTASRIQSVCNDHNQNLIASDHLLTEVGAHPAMMTKSLGMIRLKGKMAPVGIWGIDWVEKQSAAFEQQRSIVSL